MASASAVPPSWIRPLGGWRSRLVWRGMAIVVLQLLALVYGELPAVAAYPRLPPLFPLCLATAAALLIAGPRPWSLAAFASANALLLAYAALGDVEYQLAEEYLPLAALPALGLAVAWLAGRETRSPEAREAAVEAAQLALLRVALLLTMGFAAFHKLNRDFLDPGVSCAMPIGMGWLRATPFAAALEGWVPALGLLAEAAVPVTLLLWPRLGLVVTLLAMGLIGHGGATPFTGLVVVLAMAFLREEDQALLRRAFLRHGAWLLALWLAMAHLSYRLSPAHRPWSELLFFQTALLAAGFGVAHLLAADAFALWRRRAGLGGRLRAALRPAPELRALAPGPRPVRVVLAGLVLAGLLNGLSPYLGLKYRTSFAMFSNLRVDDTRWNHWIVPASLRQRPDPFVRVRSVRASAQDRDRMRALPRVRHRTLYPGLFSPLSLERRLDVLAGEGIRIDLELSWRGDSRVSRDAARDPALRSWLRGLPRPKLFQESLALSGPQPCVH